MPSGTTSASGSPRFGCYGSRPPPNQDRRRRLTLGVGWRLDSNPWVTKWGRGERADPPRRSLRGPAWRRGNLTRDTDRKAKAFFVPVAEIRENRYDLSISRYTEIEYEEVKYDPPHKIKELRGML